MLTRLAKRGFSDGLLGGSRLWLIAGAAAWLVRALQWAAKRDPQVVYREELAPGETLVINREATETARARVRRSRRRR